MTRLVRLGTLVAAVAAVVAAIRALRRDADPLPSPASSPSAPWPPLRAEDAAGEDTPTDAVPTPDAAPVDEPAQDDEAGPWVEPTEDGSCPDGYPVKANLSSKIFHSPGQLHYDRTTPDRCYADAEAAEADGLRAAKR